VAELETRDRHPRTHRADELTRPIRLEPWVLITGLVLTIAMFAMLAYSVGRDPAGTDASPARFMVEVPAVGGSDPAALRRQIAITPDGSTIVFVTSGDDGRMTLASQRIGESAPRLLGSGSALESDIVARDGTPARNSSLLSRLRGDNRTLPPDADLDGARFQQMLDPEHALVVRPRSGAAGAAAARNLDTGRETRLIDNDVVEARVAAGHIVYVRTDGTLWAAPFDTDDLKVSGRARRIGSGVAVTGSGIAQFAVARNGNVAYVPEEPRWLVVVDRRGRLRNLVAERGNYRSPRFSPDGETVSVDLTTGTGRDIYTVARGARSLTRATFTGDAHDATWSPDGRLTFTSFTSGPLGIFRAAPGSTNADSLIASPSLQYTGTWLRDGSGLVTTAVNLEAGSDWDIAFIANQGRGPVVPIVADRSRTHSPSVSPDGRWLAYVSNRTGRDEVYVRRWRGGEEVRVSQLGGSEPLWNPRGGELFYRGSNGMFPVLIGAQVDTTSGFAISERRSLFPIGDIAASAPQANYDVAPDGQTFVMVRLAPSGRISVVQNLPGVVERARNSP
jgi:Tol biopolymer transport system component